MGKMAERAKDELRQLPFMIGKVVGGIMAVGGFTALVVVLTRTPGSMAAIFLATFVGGTGVAVFALAGRLLDKRLAGQGGEPVPASDRWRTSFLAWVLLLFLGAIFLVCTYFLTR